MDRERLFTFLRKKGDERGAPSRPFSRDFFQWLHERKGDEGIKGFIERTMDRKEFLPNQIRKHKGGYLVVGQHLYYVGNSEYLALLPNLFMMWGVWKSVEEEEGRRRRVALFLTRPHITREWVEALPKHVVRPGKGNPSVLYKGWLHPLNRWETYGDEEFLSFFNTYTQLLAGLMEVKLPKLDGRGGECIVCHHKNKNITRHHITPKFVITAFIHPSEGEGRKRGRRGKEKANRPPDHLHEKFIEVPLCGYCHNHGGKGSVEHLLNVLERMYESINTIDSFILLLNLEKLNRFIIHEGLYIMQRVKEEKLKRIKEPRPNHIKKYLARDPFYEYIDSLFQQEPLPW